MASQPFQETLYPYLTIFRDQRDAETLPSYDMPSPEPTGTLSYIVEASEPDQISITSSPRTIEIHLSKPAPSSPKSSTASFHTADSDAPCGSKSNPINVDLIPTHLVNLDSGLRRS